MDRKNGAGFLLLLTLLSGCATPSSQKHSAGARDKEEAKQQAAIEEAALASVLQRVSAQKADYKISPADLLEITPYQEDDLKRSVRVSQNGTISFPLLGAVKVGDLSVLEAERVLAARLKDYLINPQVTIFIKEYGNKKVYVLGEVKRPGSYDLPTESKLTVVEAVSLAQGFTPIAASDRTKVIRITGGKSQAFTVEISAVTKRGEKEKDITLEPNDVVYVPQSFF